MHRGKGQAWGKFSWCVAAAAMLAGSSMAVAAQTFPWTNGSGTKFDASGTAQFAWVQGVNKGDANLYGDPTILNVGFDFQNTLSFQAVGGGGLGGIANNIASTIVNTGSGALGPIGVITIRETGTWSAPGGEAPETIFNLQADISSNQIVPSVPFGIDPITQLDFSASLVFTPSSEDPTFGTWTAQGVLIPANGPFVVGGISANNVLTVLASASAGSTFEKTSSVITIPEPGTLTLLVLGIYPMILRRRRS